MKRERNGQYTMTFKRDVIADHFEELKDAPMFVRKGNLQVDNPLIYNKEDISVNQIKTSETLLKDETGTSWIVGYCDKDVVAEVKSGFKASDVPVLESIDAEWDLTNNKGTARVPTSIYLAGNGGVYAIGANINSNYIPVGPCIQSVLNAGYNTVFSINSIDDVTFLKNNWYLYALNYKSAFQLGIDDYYKTNLPMIDSEDKSELMKLNDKIVYSRETNDYYKLTFTETKKKLVKKISNINLLNACKITSENIVADCKNTQITNSGEYYITTEYTEYNILLSPAIAPNTATLKISAGYNLLTDAPYAMFTLKNTPVNLDLATKLAADQAGHIYDIQILPYCPVRDAINLDTLKPLDGAVANVDYSSITFADSEEVDYLYWSKVSSGAFVINSVIRIPNNAVEFKIANECDVYRLVSPNYNGAFEFSAVKNLGVSSYDVVFTYKPYSPYIRVSPEFKGLYGQDFADARGLICNGNFSIATITDQWKTYEINNKNYENIFNAQIKTMDNNNALSILGQAISTPINAISAGIGAGVLSGNATVGAGAAGASLIGGMADIGIGQSVYQNNRQLQKDLFSMNLQTIKARPDTLNKISAYSVDNKYFPFVEYYTCTDTEKEVLRNKLKYEAMTVNAIGTINDYIGAVDEYNYFKASPIILDKIADDYHSAEAIAVELEKGVYL